MADPQSGRPWRQLRDYIVRRDHGICHLCGEPGATSADHLVPISQGGAPRDRRNLAAVHKWCNTVRGTRPIPVARADIARKLATQRDETETTATWNW